MDPTNGTGAHSDGRVNLVAEQAHTLAAYVVRVTADNVRLDRVRCDGCAWWEAPSARVPAGDYGVCAGPDEAFYVDCDWTGQLRTAPDHACNAWQPKAGQ